MTLSSQSVFTLKLKPKPDQELPRKMEIPNNDDANNYGETYMTKRSIVTRQRSTQIAPLPNKTTSQS